jgi:hypothetical protein
MATQSTTGVENIHITNVSEIQSGLATTGAKMDLVDAPNATAIAAIKTGLGTIPASGNWATACNFVDHFTPIGTPSEVVVATANLGDFIAIPANAKTVHVQGNKLGSTPLAGSLVYVYASNQSDIKDCWNLTQGINTSAYRRSIVNDGAYVRIYNVAEGGDGWYRIEFYP